MKVHNLEYRTLSHLVGRVPKKNAGFRLGRTVGQAHPRSLLDYCCISGRSKRAMPSQSYTAKGDYSDSSYVRPKFECMRVISQPYVDLNDDCGVGARRLDYCDEAQAGFAYDESKIWEKDIWITKDAKGRPTSYFKWNQDKVNYLIHYYIERGGDMSTYPFEDDLDKTKGAYKSIVMAYASRAIKESRLKSVFEKGGISDGTIIVDAKGDVTIETEEEVSLENQEEIKKKLTEAGETATALRDVIFDQSPKYVGLSGEKKNETSNLYYVGWILNRYYSTRLEDLSIEEDGSIAGLPDEVYEKKGYQFQTDFYKRLKTLLRKGVKSEDEIGRLIYRNGKLYIL